MKKAKVKARYFDCYYYKTYKIKTYVELPADANSIERIVEQMAEAACKSTFGDFKHPAMIENYQREARAALAAIGVSVSPKRKSDKQKP